MLSHRGFRGFVVEPRGGLLFPWELEVQRKGPNLNHRQSAQGKSPTAHFVRNQNLHTERTKRKLRGRSNLIIALGRKSRKKDALDFSTKRKFK